MVNIESEFKKVAHNENGVSCFYDKEHKPSSSRICASCHLTVTAMAKIQEKLGISSETVSPQKAIIKAFASVGVSLTLDDLNRSKSVLDVPVVAVADNTEEFKKWSPVIANAIKKATPEQLKNVVPKIQALKVSDETKKALIEKYAPLSKTESVEFEL